MKTTTTDCSLLIDKGHFVSHLLEWKVSLTDCLLSLCPSVTQPPGPKRAEHTVCDGGPRRAAAGPRHRPARHASIDRSVTARVFCLSLALSVYVSVSLSVGLFPPPPPPPFSLFRPDITVMVYRALKTNFKFLFV